MNSIKHYFYFVILSPFFYGFSTALHADPVSNTVAFLGSEDMYLEELPVIISATKLEQPLDESPVATSIIDRQMIDASGAQTIADLLRLVPGFTVGYLSGNTPVVTYHGQSDRYSRRIQLVIDGRSVYLPTLAGVSWSDLIISLDDIERIEVVRGPNASTYGNNAFQAVVSITTRHASDDQGHYVKATAGSHDTADMLYRFGAQSSNLDYRVTLGTKNNEGTDLTDDFTETDYFSYRLDYQLDTSTQLFYTGGYQDSVYGDVIETSTDSPNDVDVTTAFQHLRLEHNINENSSYSVQYYYNYTRSFDANLFRTISLSTASVGTPLETILANVDDFDVNVVFDLESDRHDLEFNYYYDSLDKFRLVTGVSARLDTVIADSVFHPNTDNSLFLGRAFGHGEYSLSDDWIVSAGLMVENNDISGTDYSPRLAIIHHINRQNTLRLSASKATRTPTIFDENGFMEVRTTLTQDGGDPLVNPTLEFLLGGDTVIDPFVYASGDIDSEEITSLELGWISHLMDNSLTIDLKLFSDKTRKLISDIDFIGTIPEENVGALAPAEVGAVDYANTAGTDSKGFEAYSDYQINQDWRLYAYFAYIELDAKMTNPRITDPGETGRIIGRLEESIPSTSYGAMLMKQWPGKLDTSLAVYHVSDMDWLDRTHSRNTAGEEFKDRSAQEYTRVDFVVRKSFSSGQNTVNLSLILQNLNGSYFDYSGTSYTDNTLQTVAIPGSEQDPRAYFELAVKFN